MTDRTEGTSTAQYIPGTAFVTGLRDGFGWHCALPGCPVRFDNSDDGTGPNADNVESHVREHGVAAYPRLADEEKGLSV